jgi:hypothetical protein
MEAPIMQTEAAPDAGVVADEGSHNPWIVDSSPAGPTGPPALGPAAVWRFGRQRTRCVHTLWIMCSACGAPQTCKRRSRRGSAASRPLLLLLWSARHRRRPAHGTPLQPTAAPAVLAAPRRRQQRHHEAGGPRDAGRGSASVGQPMRAVNMARIGFDVRQAQPFPITA